jgi:hypothetical protein
LFIGAPTSVEIILSAVSLGKLRAIDPWASPEKPMIPVMSAEEYGSPFSRGVPGIASIENMVRKTSMVVVQNVLIHKASITSSR